MPKRILVVGHFPTTSQTGQEVLITRGYDEAIEKLQRSTFDVIIIPAVCATTNGHSFLQKIRDYNKRLRAEKLPPLPILVHHSDDKLNIVVDGVPRVWIIGRSMCNFGNATFVNTSTSDWEKVLASWLANPCRALSEAA